MPKGNHPRLTQAAGRRRRRVVRARPAAHRQPTSGDPPPDLVQPRSRRRCRPTSRARWPPRAGRAVNRDAASRCTAAPAWPPTTRSAASPARSRRTNRVRHRLGARWPAPSCASCASSNFKTFFWMRSSSADGRFIGNGAPSTARAHDHRPAARCRHPGPRRPTTPASSPTTRAGCSRARRSAPASAPPRLLSSNPARSTSREAQCSSVSGVALYQHLAAAWAAATTPPSTASSPPTTAAARHLDRTPAPASRSNAQIKLITPMAFDGNHYQSQARHGRLAVRG
jgi:hypothetical protein